MTLTRREQKRLETELEIKAIARKQIAEVGAVALSLRAIAREMRMSAPALYRYFPNKEALVTTLIVEAYTALADAMADADAAKERDDFHGRFQAICFAYRDWAMSHPQDYTLIYGTPIPNYHAPRELTVAPAGRVLLILNDAWQADRLSIPAGYEVLPDELATAVQAVLQTLPEGVPGTVVPMTMIIWSQLQGLVWGELYGQFSPGLAESGKLYQLEIQTMTGRLFS